MPCHSNAPASVNSGSQYSFSVGTGDWSFAGSSPCPGGVSTCYNVESVSVTASNGASVSSSYTWSSSTLTVSATVSNRLGPVSVTYVVVVRRYAEETLQRQVNYAACHLCHVYDQWDNYLGYYRDCGYCGCCDSVCCTTENYQARVDKGTTQMSASATLLLLPTGVTVYAQPASSYTAATTTTVSVTLQLAPAVEVTTGHPFTAEMTSVSKSGADETKCLSSQASCSPQVRLSVTFKAAQV